MLRLSKGDFKMKVRIIIISFLISSLAAAADMGITLGYRSDSATANSGAAIESKNNVMIGGVGLVDLGPQIVLRLGFNYTPRSFGLVSGEAKFTYIDIPVGILWKFSDYGGAFAGVNPSLMVSGSCPGGCSGTANMPVGYQFGIQFKFAPQMGLAMYYESMGALTQGIDSAKAVAVQFLYTFD
jgi:hypothetical protein